MQEGAKIRGAGYSTYNRPTSATKSKAIKRNRSGEALKANGVVAATLS